MSEPTPRHTMNTIETQTGEDTQEIKRIRVYEIQVHEAGLRPLIVGSLKEIPFALEQFMGDCVEYERGWGDDEGVVYSVVPRLMTKQALGNLPEWDGP